MSYLVEFPNPPNAVEDGGSYGRCVLGLGDLFACSLLMPRRMCSRRGMLDRKGSVPCSSIDRCLTADRYDRIVWCVNPS